MDEVLGRRPSVAPPVLIASIPEDTPGPGAAEAGQHQGDDEEDNEDEGGGKGGREEGVTSWWI